jgi:hypothetical protein
MRKQVVAGLATIAAILAGCGGAQEQTGPHAERRAAERRAREAALARAAERALAAERKQAAEHPREVREQTEAENAELEYDREHNGANPRPESAVERRKRERAYIERIESEGARKEGYSPKKAKEIAERGSASPDRSGSR